MELLSSINTGGDGGGSTADSRVLFYPSYPDEVDGLGPNDPSIGSHTEAVSTIDDVSSPTGRADCIVLTDPSEGSLDRVLGAIDGRDRGVPVIVYPSDRDPGVATAAATAEGVTYLPPEAGPESLAECIEHAIERARRREGYRRSGTILKSLLDQFPYSFFVKNEEAEYVLATTEDGNEEEIVGKTDFEWFGTENHELARETYEDDRQVIESGEPIFAKEEFHAEGDHWAETTKMPWRDESGDIRGLVGVSIDITPWKRLEEELERKRALHRRIAEFVAHDIRNPITVSRGYLDRLASDPTDTESIEAIEESLDQIEDVLTSIEFITGDDTEQFDQERTNTDLRELVTEVWERLETPGASLEIEVPDAARIRANPSALRELIDNLLRNAIEHGGEEVSVRVGPLPDGFYVADDGPGFPDDVDRSVMFEYGASSKDSGGGIGLAIVAEIANTYDWDVDVKTGERNGTRFDITGTKLISRPPDPPSEKPRRTLESNTDIGSATPPGNAQRVTDDTWVVSGGGRDVWHDTNEHHFAYAEITGDDELACELVDLTTKHEFTKAGVMIRTGLDESAPFGFVGGTASHGSEALWRPTRDSLTTSVPLDDDTSLPQWYRIVRNDDTMTVSISPDGDSWTHVDQRVIDADPTVYVGLVACSHDPESLTEARFANVTCRGEQG